MSLEALDNKAKELKPRQWVSDYGTNVDKIQKQMGNLIKNYDKPLSRSNYETDEDAVNAYLVQALQESTNFVRAGTYGTNPFSDYRFLIGGSWVHTDSSAAEGTLTASMFIRTRLFGQNIKNLSLQDEKDFLDLMIDAQFITNEPFNNITLINPAKQDSAAAVFLKATKSSKVSVALYYAFDYHFADRGVIGPTIRYTISTKEKSGDIFRRLTLGLRLENRSELILRGASAEVGITANNAAGSLERDKKVFDFRRNFERIVLDFELPLTNKTTRRGLYVQFHGEWPIRAKDKILLRSGVPAEIAPPIYQFRLGGTFDPIKLFGPFFGS